MEISQILQQPEGYTPPQVTVRIKKVHPYKSGTNNNGPWSFQNVEVEGGKLKLKSLPEFPKAREGQSVTLRANQSKQHGLTGIKVNHEEYNGSTYHQLVITNSCKWEWAGQQSQNGASSTQSTASHKTHPDNTFSTKEYIDHLLSCAFVTTLVTERLKIEDEQATQSCFATICIDTKNRGIVLPTNVIPEQKAAQEDPFDDAPPPSMVSDNELPPDYDDDIPF